MLRIDDRRSIREIVKSGEYQNDIKTILEYLRIKDKLGVKALTIAIIQQAVDDLELLEKKVNMFYERCDMGRLDGYNTDNMIPFGTKTDETAVDFFDSEWGQTLLESVNLNVVPLSFRARIDEMKRTQAIWQNHCSHCVKAQKDRERRDKINQRRVSTLKMSQNA